MAAGPKPEIMSPAGYWPQLHAAIDAGADSVYFGLHHFSARAKVGFSLAELREVMRTLHRRGVKGYVTFNTLIFEHEMEAAAKTLAGIAEAGADAIIVQDLGVLKLAREVAPSLEIHGSTQMSITSAGGVRLAQEMGVSRVTLARELSLKEIRAIRNAVDCELEIFVHGALCVAYSGQCFSSEAWGGRSANRGQCAQACRLPYEMMVDGEVRPLGDARYLLSPGDLFALRQVPEIVDIGISALKIEGRYKDAEYVALTTRAYREAVDGAAADRATEQRLEQVYSRGLGPFFLTGTDHQAVVRGRAPRHRGVLVGRVAKVSDGAVTIEPGETAIKPGDGIVFDAADWRSPQEPEEGGRVFEAVERGGCVELRFANRAIDTSRIRRGDLVWRTHDPDVDKFVRAMEPRRQKVDVRVTAREGELLVTEWKAGRASVTVSSERPLEAARNRAIDEEYLRAQLGRLGNTAYELAGLVLEIEGRPFAPPSLLNDLRREAVERLQAECETPARPLPQTREYVPALRQSWTPNHGRGGVESPTLHLLVRTPEQLDAAIALRPASITLDYLDLYGLRPALDRVRTAGLAPRVAAPRVLKPGEERIVDFLVSCNCPILVRSTGLLHALRERPHAGLIGDFSLNAANSQTAESLLALGLDFLTPTYDLNADQVADLGRHTGGGALEAVAYQHLPVFHTEHCVFCRFLSTGTSYHDCGRPCEHHRVSLRDEAGRAHPVMADVGCRNTVFGAEAQEASRHMEAWLAAGIGRFRLEFAHESAGQVTRVTEAFANALAGCISWQDAARELGRATSQGTTEGSLYVPEGYKLLPVLQ
jgi:putative protease